MIVTAQLFIQKTLIESLQHFTCSTALLTADPLTLSAAGIIHGQTVDREAEFLDAFSMASLELFSLCSARISFWRYITKR